MRFVGPYKYACMMHVLGPARAGAQKKTDDPTFMAIVEHFFLENDMEKNFDTWTQVYEALGK